MAMELVSFRASKENEERINKLVKAAKRNSAFFTMNYLTGILKI